MGLFAFVPFLQCSHRSTTFPYLSNQPGLYSTISVACRTQHSSELCPGLLAARHRKAMRRQHLGINQLKRQNVSGQN